MGLSTGPNNKARLEYLLRYIGIRNFSNNPDGTITANLRMRDGAPLLLHFMIENNAVFIENPVMLDVNGKPFDIVKFKTAMLVFNSMNTKFVFALAPIRNRKLGVVIRSWHNLSGLDGEGLTELIMAIHRGRTDKAPLLVSMARKFGLRFTGGGSELRDILDTFFN